MWKVELDAPNVGLLEAEYIIRAIRENYLSTYGPYVPEFEEKFAEYIGVNRAVSVQSGTAGLHIALYELGIGKGDEVIVPATSFIATANPILYVGAKPVFVDVDPLTWTIDVDKLKEAITSRTKAIIPVHIYGVPAKMDAILEMARERDIYVIEDATESLGAVYKGKMTGAWGDIGVFSFNGNKVITTGGGGMVTLNDEKRADHIKFLVNQARDASKGYFHPEMGFNYRMTNLEASLGLAQMERLPEFLEKKRRFREIYKELLGDVLTFQEAYDESNPSWWLTSVLLPEGVDVAEFQARLREEGIPTRRIFYPMPCMPYFEGEDACGRYPVAMDIYRRGLNLPSSTLNSEEDIRWVAGMIREILEKI